MKLLEDLGDPQKEILTLLVKKRKVTAQEMCKALKSRPRQRRCKEMFAELSNYLDEELDDSLCEELEKHMDGCGPCKAFLSSLEKSIQQCRMAPDESPDPRIAARLRRELIAGYQELTSGVTGHAKIQFDRS